MGDTFWYLAIIENTLPLPKLTLDDGLNAPDSDATFWLGEMQDVVKRAIFYGEELFTVNKKGVLPVQRLALAVCGISYCLQTVNRYYVGKAQAYYFETNIKKLAKRYPELIFKSEDAIERNVENELSHIPDASADSKGYGHDHEDVHEEPEEAFEDVLKNNPLAENTVAQALLARPTRFTNAADLGRTELQQESGLMGRVEFNLANLAPPAISVESLFDNVNTHEICTQDIFNHFIRETYTTDQIEKLAMTLAFNTAAYYRSINAVGIARAYDDLYKQYSGKGDKLEDYSCYVMWRDLGYSLQKNEIVNKIAELRL